MRSSPIAPALVLALLAPLAAAQQSKDKSSIAEELQAYYDKGKMPAAWEAALKRLTSKDAAERDQAAVYLRDVLTQALKDELSGAAPWRATPYWDSSGENPAIELRKWVATSLVESPSAANVVLVQWFLDHEKLPRPQADVLKSVADLDTPEAAKLRLAVVQLPHPNAAVLVEALTQIGRHKSKPPADIVTALCHHHRQSVREQARKLNKEMGGADPGPFDPVKAVQAPAVRKLLDAIGPLLLERPPDKAEFVAVTTAGVYKDRKYTETTFGWLLQRMDNKVTVLSPFGKRWQFELHEKPRKTEDGEETCTLAAAPIAKEVDRVVTLRAKGDPNFQLSERGGLTGQFQGGGMGLYEVMLAHWLYVQGKHDLAAKLFLPGLDTLYRDDDVVNMVRHRCGEQAGYRMLVAFAGDRDMAETLRLAEQLVKHYPDTRFHHYAVKLAKEMPLRQDDFKKLKLPTPAEWAETKKAMNRREQVAFLVERLRLLNCFQDGQPGGYFLGDKQYAEPCGISDNAAWGLGRGKTEVVNPLVELAGPVDGFLPKGQERPKGMELIVADIPTIAPFLMDDWHLLCVGFWRDFHPNRSLETTRPLVAKLINNIAKRDLCSAEALAPMTRADREKDIARIVQWAKDNAGKKEVELIWDALADELKTEKTWREVRHYVRALAERKEKKALPVLRSFFDKKSTRPDDLPGMLDCLFLLDAKAGKEIAPKYLDHESAGVRLFAAWGLYDAGERQMAHPVLGQILEKDIYPSGYGHLLPDLIDLLLAEKTEAGLKTAGRIFKNPDLSHLDNRTWVARRFGEVGVADGYRFYLTLLETKGNTLGSTTYGGPVAEVFADEIISWWQEYEAALKDIAAKTKGGPERVAAVKEWLQQKIKIIEKK